MKHMCMYQRVGRLSMQGWHRHDTPTFPYKTAQNSQTRQLQALLDTYMYSTSAFVPTKTHEVRKIHSYNDLQKLVKPHFSSSSSSVKLAYCPSATSTRDGFYTKRLLSVACVILDQENLRNFTQSCITEDFPYLLEAIFCMCTCNHVSQKGGAQARGSAGVEGGGARANTSKYIRMVKHCKEAEMDTAMYPRKKQ